MGGSLQSIIQKYYPFEFVVNTTLSGSSGVGNYQLQLNPVNTYRYYVDWGDGIISASTTTTNLTHTYPSGGTYTVKIYGRFDGIYNNSTAESEKITSINSWGNVKWRKFINSFDGCSSLTGTPATSPIFEKVDGNFSSSFRYCSNFNSDIGYLGTSKVTNMSNMFQFNTNFNNGGSPSISGWTINTTNNVSMYWMFRATAPFNQPIGSWNVSKVTNMESMFHGASSFNQNIGSWNVSGVTTFTNFMQDKTFSDYSTTNLDAIYNGWSTLPSVQSNRNITFNTIKYTAGGSAGRAILSGTYLWTITDGGI